MRIDLIVLVLVFPAGFRVFRSLIRPLRIVKAYAGAWFSGEIQSCGELDFVAELARELFSKGLLKMMSESTRIRYRRLTRHMYNFPRSKRRWVIIRLTVSFWLNENCGGYRAVRFCGLRK
jgi:hypothetical protein